MTIQIEFAIEYFQDVTHKCPSCHAILGRYLCVNMLKTRPNSWAKQVREIEWGQWTLDFMKSGGKTRKIL